MSFLYVVQSRLDERARWNSSTFFDLLMRKKKEKNERLFCCQGARDERGACLIQISCDVYAAAKKTKKREKKGATHVNINFFSPKP